MRITVRWQGNKWYEGVCKAYNPDQGEHLVHYMDNDLKWYILANKTWRPVAREAAGWQAAAGRVLRDAGGLRPGIITQKESGETWTLTADDCDAVRAAILASARNGQTVVVEDDDGDSDDANNPDAVNPAGPVASV